MSPKDLLLYIGFAAPCLCDLPSLSLASVSLCVKLAQQYAPRRVVLIRGDNTALCSNAQLMVAVIMCPRSILSVREGIVLPPNTSVED